MLNLIKNKIKNNEPLYNSLTWVQKFLRAVKAVNVNVDSLREFSIWAKGGQELSEYNLKFYRNFINSVVKPSKKKFHFIDVGANDGWFAKSIFRLHGNVQITSYEPLISQHEKLEILALKNSNFCFRKKAVGESFGSLTLSEYGTSGLSSLKEISAEYNYSDHYSQAVVNQYTVPIVRLDDDLNDIIRHKTSEDEFVLKIDTQGFEFEVLRGAKQHLSQGVFKWIIIELMTVEKYANGHLYDEILVFLHANNYRLWDVNSSYYEPLSGRLTEFDAIFTYEPPSA